MVLDLISHPKIPNMPESFTKVVNRNTEKPVEVKQKQHLVNHDKYPKKTNIYTHTTVFVMLTILSEL